MYQLFLSSDSEMGLNESGRIAFLFHNEDPCHGESPNDGFFGRLEFVSNHPDPLHLLNVLSRAVDLPDVALIAVIANPSLIPAEDFVPNIRRAVENTTWVTDAGKSWSVLAPTGMTFSGAQSNVAFAQLSPEIPTGKTQRALADLAPDFYLINPDCLRACLRRENLPAISLNTLPRWLLLEGYFSGFVGLFAPELSVGYLGRMTAVDAAVRDAELALLFHDTWLESPLPNMDGSLFPGTASPSGQKQHLPRDLMQAVKETLAALTTPLSLSVVIRTTFDRAYLLRRGLSKLSRYRHKNVALEILICTDIPAAKAKAGFARMAEEFPHLTLRLVQSKGEPHSRVRNLLSGLRAAKTDYVIVIDDDDYIETDFFDHLMHVRLNGDLPLMLGSCAMYQETWEEAGENRWVLANTQPHGTWPAIGIRDMFSGSNQLPVCAMVMPVKWLQRRLKDFTFKHDLSEDYTLFLLLLSDPSLPAIQTMHQNLVNISIRNGGDNSVTMEDRRPWIKDIRSFLHDLCISGTALSEGQTQVLSGHVVSPHEG